jgi:type II secretory pathway component GspD/PulD (secretin)
MGITDQPPVSTTPVSTGEPAKPGAPSPKPGAADDNLIQLNFPENVEVKLLIDYVARRLGMNLIYDDAIVHKKVSILAPAKVPKDSLLGLLQSVLKATGLVMVDGDQPNWKRIVPAQSLLAVTDKLERDPERLATADKAVPMTQIFHLKYVTTASMESVLKPFLGTPGGNSLPIPDRNMVIVTDYTENLRRIADVIDLFDRPATLAKIQFIPVENWDAAELAAQVTSLLRERQRAVGSEKAAQSQVTLTAEPKSNRIVLIAAEGAEGPALELIQLLDVATTAETRTYRFRNISPGRIDKLARDFAGSDSRQRYRSTVDEQGGLLVVTAAPHVHRHIENLARDLDVSVSDEEKPIRFYKLMNTTAMEVLATIQSIESGPGGVPFKPSVPVTGTSAPGWPGPNRPPGAPGEESPKPPAYKPPAEEAKGEGAAKPDEKPKAEDKVAAKPAAVQSEAAGVQISRLREAIVTADANTNTLIVVAPPAVQQVYEQLIRMLDKRRPQVMIEATLVTLDTTDNCSLGVEIEGINIGPKTTWLVFSQFGLSTTNSAGSLAIAPGTGLNGTVIDAGVISAVVRALATSGHAKIVSAPKIMVNDNASGSLSSVSEAPFTSVNASNTVATTSFAGYASAGTTITVTPHISQGDHLQLNYTVTLSSFTGQGSAGVPPPRQTDTVNSTITVPNGNAVIIGGLTRKDLSESVSKIPLLGDIPGAGALFSSRSSTNTQSTLFVFLRPVILRDELFEDLRYLSDQALEKAGFPDNFPANPPMAMK